MSKIDSDYILRYAEPATFFRLPYEKKITDKNNLDIAIFGIPWDSTATDRPGARFAPQEIRKSSTYSRNIHGIHKINPFELCNIMDIGDIEVVPTNRSKTFNRITEKVKLLQAMNIIPIAVGGDHLVTLPILEGINPKKPLALIHIDAHIDTWDVDFDDETMTHGTVFRRAIEGGLINPKKMIQLGIRELIHSPNDLKFANESGITIITSDDVHIHNIDSVCKIIKSVIGSDNCYLSIDIDALDPSCAPGTGTPEICGLTTHTLIKILHNLYGINFIGADIVEVSPPYDNSNITTLTASAILYEELCLCTKSVIKRLSV